MAGYVDSNQVCQPWTVPGDLCCQQVGTVPDATLIAAVSNILYIRTCRRYPGLCSYTVWPCNECDCGCHPCACGTWSALRLPTDYPVQSVSAVRLDGVPFLDYRVDRSQWLVRTDGQRWPSCNSFGLPNSNAVEIQVDMVVGREVPPELKLAAEDLVCEIKKACNADATCTLDPTHLRRLERRGVELEFTDITELFSQGLTGVPTVDLALKVHGNCSYVGAVFDPAGHNFRGYGVS